MEVKASSFRRTSGSFRTCATSPSSSTFFRFAARFSLSTCIDFSSDCSCAISRTRLMLASFAKTSAVSGSKGQQPKSWHPIFTVKGSAMSSFTLSKLFFMAASTSASSLCISAENFLQRRRAPIVSVVEHCSTSCTVDSSRLLHAEHFCALYVLCRTGDGNVSSAGSGRQLAMRGTAAKKRKLLGFFSCSSNGSGSIRLKTTVDPSACITNFFPIGRCSWICLSASRHPWYTENWE
mmetsp:Transcript_2526/g.6038  ORF Transcript_2526/g.6038 Transcript_2526/m.6038 type:complete len:236 (-) Transcript_2526:376-1083(-)